MLLRFGNRGRGGLAFGEWPLPHWYKQRPVALPSSNGRPQDVLWRGGALHFEAPQDSSVSTELHAHFAIQVTIGMQHSVAVRSRRNAQKRIAGGWLIASNQPHWIQSDGGYVTIFLDPLSANGRRVKGRLGDAGMLALSPDESQAAEHEFESLQSEWSVDAVQPAVDRVLRLLAPCAAAVPELDLRVQTVVNELIADASEHVSLQVLAASVRLSESRLAHLFRRDVGVPIRQYRLWLRMHEAITQIALGKSLSESAHMAGFADSSHLCRICRRMFGSSPSGLPDFVLKENSL